MKRLNKLALMLLAGVAMSACVQEEEFVVFDSSSSVAPVLKAFEGATLAEDGTAIEIEFEAAQFNVISPVGHSFYAAPAGVEKGSSVSASISNGKVTITQKDLNAFIINNGGVNGEEFAVDFWMEGYLCNDKTAAIAQSIIKSNVVTVSFIPYDVVLNDSDKYSIVWIIGASDAVGAWDHKKVKQYLYNYNSDGKTYSGLIYYGDNAAGGWKITGSASWDNDKGNWGSEAQAEEAEAVSVQLVSGDGSKDIKCYSKQYYMWNFDKESLKLTKEYGFNNIGLVGSINGWNQADADLKMNYNADFHRFWIDYTFADADQEIKFTCDDDWGLNFGQDCKTGGDNIKAPAGSFRIYLDLNNKAVTFDARMFGQEEPTLGSADGGDDQPAFEGWSIIGTINGTNWDTDFDMTEESEGVWTYKNLTVTETDEFKIRLAHDWVTSVGGPEKNDKSTINPENVYDVFKPTVGTAFNATSDNSQNIAIHIAGSYDIVYDTTAGTITIAEHLPGWALIGMVEDSQWDKDFEMKEGAAGVWTSEPVVINGEFKLRYNGLWEPAENNRGGAFVALDKPFAVVPGGSNIAVPVAGDKYIVTYYSKEDAVSIHSISKSWSIIGMVNGTSWDSDVLMYQTSENVWSGTCKVNSEFKIRFGGAWEIDRGGAYAAMDAAFEVTQGGANIKLDEGYYTITYNAASEQITISEAWGLIGLNSNWDSDTYWMIKDGEGNYVCNNAILNSEWKIRKNAGWDVNRGGTFVALDTPFAVENNGANIAAVEGLVNVVYKAADETITISKAL